MFSKILIAIDGSVESMLSADYAIFLAKEYDANLIGLHVLPSGLKKEYYDYELNDIPVWIRDNILQYRQEVESWFKQIKKKYETRTTQQLQGQQQGQKEDGNKGEMAGLLLDTVNMITSISGTIVIYAESENIDLIVMGSKGLSGIKNMLLGSVAQEVVSHSHCPVLVVR
jgi:nucleotide-binding universal stress UspA family protein